MYRGNAFTDAAWNAPHIVDEEVTAQEALEFLALTDQGVKFTDGDVLDFHEDYALAFLREYDGDFEFLLAIKVKADRGDDLPVGAVRGVLNCMRTENQRQARMAQEAEEQAAAPLAVVEAARYCLLNKDKRRYFQVDRPEKGHWAGLTFVRELHIGGSDNGQRQVRDRTEKASVLDAIAADPDALARYGRETGTCGVCHRTLTDPLSIELGIGPVCRTKGGY